MLVLCTCPGFMQLKLFFSQVTFAKPKSSRNSSIGKSLYPLKEDSYMCVLYAHLASMCHIAYGHNSEIIVGCWAWEITIRHPIPYIVRMHVFSDSC